jgi:hypothetical protein
MRLRILQQQAKVLQREKPETGADISKQIENVKHLLWQEHSRSARRDTNLSVDVGSYVMFGP